MAKTKSLPKKRRFIIDRRKTKGSTDDPEMYIDSSRGRNPHSTRRTGTGGSRG